MVKQKENHARSCVTFSELYVSLIQTKAAEAGRDLDTSHRKVHSTTSVAESKACVSNAELSFVTVASRKALISDVMLAAFNLTASTSGDQVLNVFIELLAKTLLLTLGMIATEAHMFVKHKPESRAATLQRGNDMSPIRICDA